MTPSPRLLTRPSRIIAAHPVALGLLRQAESAGLRGMRFEAMRKLFAGEISSAEVLRLTRA